MLVSQLHVTHSDLVIKQMGAANVKQEVRAAVNKLLQKTGNTTYSVSHFH